MSDYLNFYEKYKNKVNFLTIYTLEAHWVEEKENDLDGWPIGHDYRIERHKNIDDRINMSITFIEEFKWNIPTVVDNMNDDFNKLYASWPDAAYVILDWVLYYKSKIPDGGMRFHTWTKEIEQLFDS